MWYVDSVHILLFSFVIVKYRLIIDSLFLNVTDGCKRQKQSSAREQLKVDGNTSRGNYSYTKECAISYGLLIKERLSSLKEHLLPFKSRPHLDFFHSSSHSEMDPSPGEADRSYRLPPFVKKVGNRNSINSRTWTRWQIYFVTFAASRKWITCVYIVFMPPHSEGCRGPRWYSVRVVHMCKRPYVRSSVCPSIRPWSF